MAGKRAIPEINAGSMADIAFLLLIFFLVTTTMDVDKGINRKLPPYDDQLLEDPPPIKKKNIFEVLVNSNDALLVEEEYLDISRLREEAKRFLNNNGDGTCCGGDVTAFILSSKCDNNRISTSGGGQCGRIVIICNGNGTAIVAS